MCLFGIDRPELRMAERTRSLASSTALSGSPTILNIGRPLLTSTSTSIGTASNPTTAVLLILAIAPMRLAYSISSSLLALSSQISYNQAVVIQYTWLHFLTWSVRLGRLHTEV